MTEYKTYPIVQQFAHPECCEHPIYNDQVVEERIGIENTWRVAGFCENCETEYCKDIKLKELDL